ncbi:MAG: GNAT family N-acetyltransferase [Sphingomonadaceae bacterium]
MNKLRIVEFRDDLADDFYAINAEWIEAMFVMEPHDRDVLSDPRAHIIDTGGAILLVEADGFGIVGACALMPLPDGAVELTKMGVREAARGRNAGDFLLAAVIARAEVMKADPLFLLTNHICAAAIHLYEKHGFRHDTAIMAQYGATYARCDVAMRYSPASVLPFTFT